MTGATVFSDFVLGEISWESYQEVGRTTIRDTFNTSYTIVYMKGAGFADGTYNVAYYDGGGAKVETDSSLTVAGDGLLDDSFIALTDYPSATTGTWHALVQ
ncbi:hypothetical protein, partial [Pseudomonas sp.]|uniref:hypothetical protein n=1 Tax=Pseudomonas sp. TaxID=306 RepID=UPI002718B652